AVNSDLRLEICRAEDALQRRDEEGGPVMLVVEHFGCVVIRYLSGDPIRAAATEARLKLDLHRGFLTCGERAPSVGNRCEHGIGERAILVQDAEADLRALNSVFETQSHGIGHARVS